jgi:hypothetical protein
MQIIRNYVSRIEVSNDDNQVFTLAMEPTPASQLREGQCYLKLLTVDHDLKYFKVDGPVPNDVQELTEFYEDTFGRQMGFTRGVEFVRITEADHEYRNVSRTDSPAFY